jgi:hypothetical protein
MTIEDASHDATVYVACSAEPLRLALARRIGLLSSFRVVADGARDSWMPPGAVVAPVADVTPEECRVLRSRGLYPVVLAPLPSEWQRADYEASGAVYLAMDPNPAELIAAISRLR